MSVIDRALGAQARSAVIATQTRLNWWARGFRGLQPRFPVMASPPTVTIGGTTSTLNGAVSYTTLAQWTSGKMTLAGAASNIADAGGRAIAQVTTISDNTVYTGAVQHVRFITSAPAFEVPFKGTTGQLNVIVDGEIATRSRGLVEMWNDGNPHQIKFDFGANNVNSYLAVIAKAAGGSGYALGDTITLAGGTGTPAALTVLQVSSGAVVAVAVKAGGAYSAVPTGTIAQASTSGAGTGATFGSAVWSEADTTRKSRRIELLYLGGIAGSPLGFAGINVAATENILPWPVSPRVPRLVILGDSQQNTYVDYAGGTMGCSIAQRLGMWDNLVITSNGGTGYLTPNGTSLPWTDSRRVADIVNQAPDVVLIIGGQNDAGQNQAALTAAVTSMLNSLLAALPKALFVGIGPVTGNGAGLTAAIAAGWTAASDQNRVRFIDNVTVPWVSGSGRVTAPNGTGTADWMVSSDAVHLIQGGLDNWADIASARVGDALLDMATR